MELTIPNIKYLIKYILYTTPWIYLFLVKLKIIEKVHFYSRKTIYNNVEELLLDNDIERIIPGSSTEDLVKIMTEIFKEAFNNSKIVAFQFKYINSDLDTKVN